MPNAEPAPPRSAHSLASADAVRPAAEVGSEPRRPAVRCGGWQLPQAGGGFWLLGALTLGCALVLMRTPAGLPTAKPVPAPECAVPVEMAGQGVLCLSAAAAQQRGLAAGDLCPTAADGTPAAGPPGRMAPRRLLAAGVRLDPQTATAAELEALPEVGAGLARRIIQARTQRASNREPPRWRQADLLQIPGLGERRLKRLLPFLIPLP